MTEDLYVYTEDDKVYTETLTLTIILERVKAIAHEGAKAVAGDHVTCVKALAQKVNDNTEERNVNTEERNVNTEEHMFI